MKKVLGSSSDFISNLPENIVENILVHMPIRDAVKTSVLSKKWRYSWRNMPQLLFDDMLLARPIPVLLDQVVLPDQLSTKHRLLVAIYHVLLLHCGPILSFSLASCHLTSCPEIDTLITVLSSNGIQELTLQFLKGDPYKLPSSLFSCRQLKHLNLRSCVLKPPTMFKGFSRVVCLELCEVIITEDTFQSLVSSCPLLEQLTFESSTSFDRIEIVAPNLKVLNLVGVFKSLCVKNAPRLANFSIYSKVSVGVLEGGDKFDWVRFLNGLPVLENLHVGQPYLSFFFLGVRPHREFPTLRYLKVLKLSASRIWFGVVWCTIALMANSTKLQKVTIEVISYVGSATMGSFESVIGNSSYYLPQLREVEMCLVSGATDDLRFIKFFLANSPKLENLVVKPDPAKVTDGGLRILKELSKFERLSSKAKITYKDPNEN